MEDIITVSIPIVGFVCLVAIIKTIAEHRLRRRMAETHADPELVRAFAETDAAAREQTSLKWGILLTLVSVAFLLVEALGFTAQDPGAFGLVCGAVGVGLLVTRRFKARRY